MFSWDIFVNAEVLFSWVLAHHPDSIYFALFTIVFLESGVFFMPFLPGDSLLVIAGASLLRFSLDPLHLLSSIILGAFWGNILGYMIGFFLRVWRGRRRTISFFLQDGWFVRIQTFLEQYGRLSVVLVRFMPFFRTFFPFLAGVFKAPFGAYVLFSFLGSVLWTLLFVLIGFFLGHWDFVQKWLGRVALFMVFFSLFSFSYWIYRRRRPESK